MKNNIDISTRSLKYNGIFVLTIDWYKNKKCYTFDRLLFHSSTTKITNNTTLLLTYEYIITESNNYTTLYFYFINDGKFVFNTELYITIPNDNKNINYYIKKIIRKIKRCTRVYRIKVKNINLGTTRLLY